MIKEESKENKALYKSYLKRLKRLEVIVSFLSILGIFICLYSIQVEIYKSRDNNYVAFCDINDYISCSKVFQSEYGKGFGLMPKDSILNQHNSIYGLVFFIFQLLLCKKLLISKKFIESYFFSLVLFRSSPKAFQIRIFLSVLANMGSVYLAYILYFILHDFCIVCVSFYFINGLLLFFNVKHYNYFKFIKTVNISKQNKKRE